MINVTFCNNVFKNCLLKRRHICILERADCFSTCKPQIPCYGFSKEFVWDNYFRVPTTRSWGLNNYFLRTQNMPLLEFFYTFWNITVKYLASYFWRICLEYPHVGINCIIKEISGKLFTSSYLGVWLINPILNKKTSRQNMENLRLLKVYYLLKNVENIAKEETAHLSNFILLPQCFQKLSAAEMSESFCRWEKDKMRFSPYVLDYKLCLTVAIVQNRYILYFIFTCFQVGITSIQQMTIEIDLMNYWTID